MKLLGVEKEGNWLFSEWELTYRIGWGHVCRAAALIFRYMKDPQVLTGSGESESTVPVKEPWDLLSLEEAGWLTIRGLSDVLLVPVMITFYNQSDLVRVSVHSETEEFSKADYKAFNLSMCRFMDSIELAMYE